MFGDCRLEALDELFDFYKDSCGIFLVSEWFDNMGIVQELFEN